jgi:glycosyltransferase involved in cell wall biosynthesis
MKIKFALYFLPLFLFVRILTGINNIFIKKSRKKKIKRILYLESYPDTEAGYKYRTDHWLKILEKEGYIVEVRTLMNQNELNLMKSGNVNVLIKHMYRRLKHCIYAYRFDSIIVRRALLPYNDYGNLFFEKLIVSIKSNTILDFDDDMNNNRNIQRCRTLYGKLLFENTNKFYNSLNIYSYFISGSEHLKELILKYNSKIDPQKICVIPTCVDYNNKEEKQYKHINDPIRIGWIGSNGNQFYLDNLKNVLNEINTTKKIILVVISGTSYSCAGNEYEIENIKWNLNTEYESLLSLDIGIMPINDTPMDRGKCGFKLIQYMGAGLVSIADAVGANKEIIKNESMGFLVNKNKSWKDCLLDAINLSLDKKNAMGASARFQIDNNYTFMSNKIKYLEYIQNFN